MLKTAFLGVALAAASLQSVSAAPVNVSVLGGYQWSPDVVQKHQSLSSSYSQQEHAYINAAIGTKVKDVGVQLEYSQVKPGNLGSADLSAKQETTAIVAQLPLLTAGKTSLYGLGGAGYTRLTASDRNTADGLVGIVGVGAEYALNPTVSLLAEGRAQWSEFDNYWQPQALAGVRINMNQMVKNIQGK